MDGLSGLLNQLDHEGHNLFPKAPRTAGPELVSELESVFGETIAITASLDIPVLDKYREQSVCR
ncbi:MAG TPA: hypothetical protein VK735_09130 [Pseudonocardia sp.]|uniref:hypothetical protein n=1 Tax=Pseudonocardia sp. TaxID=60912 RepID=UPI002CF269E6|nr:hypothetical protein [Pseudonocardia sp.]HTF47596.1 hypothetical protein [Pseudonocardia sp.]